MDFEWSGWRPCRQDVFQDRLAGAGESSSSMPFVLDSRAPCLPAPRFSTSSFFHSGRNAAEERFWQKFVHRDGSYGRGGVWYIMAWYGVMRFMSGGV